MARELTLLAVCAAALLALFPFGLLMAAGAFLVVGIVDLGLSGALVIHYFRVPPGHWCRAWSSNLALTLLCASVAWGVVRATSGVAPWQVVLALAAVLVPVWYVGLWCFRHPLWPELNRLPDVYRVLIRERRLPLSWTSRYQAWRYRRPLARILARFSELPPTPCQPGAEVELHMLTCAGDLDMALASLKSLLRYQPGLAVVVHGDDSLSEEHAQFLTRQVPGCRVILRAEADRRFARWPALAALRAQLPERFSLGAGMARQRAAWALKVLDFHCLAEARRVIVLDSDTLFVNRPDELLAWIHEAQPEAFYSVPSGPNFRLNPEDCRALFPGLDYPERFNGGLFGYDRSRIDSERVTAVLQTLMAHPHLPLYGDECIWRLILAQVPHRALAFEQYPLITNARPETRRLVDLDVARYVHFILKHRGGVYASIAQRVWQDMKAGAP